MAYSYFTTPTNGTGRTIQPTWGANGPGGTTIPAPTAPAAPTSTPGMFGATPTQGQGAYGLVPGQIAVPAQAQQNIQNDLSGLVSPEIMSRLQNQAARFGVTSGMPGSGLQWNSYLHDYLGAGQAAQQRGFENYKSLLPLAERNAELAAAPDPTQRAQTEQSFAQQMFDKYLSALRSPAGATGNYRGGGGGGGGNDPFNSPYQKATITPDTRTGGIAAVQNPYSPRPTNSFVYPGSDPSGGTGPDTNYFYPDEWQAPVGTSYDPSANTYNAPDEFANNYWNDIFNP